MSRRQSNKDENDELLRDGESLRVRMTLMDALQRSVAAGSNKAAAKAVAAAVKITEAKLAADKAAVDPREAAYAEVKLRDENAWRHPHLTIDQKAGDVCTINGAPGHWMSRGGGMVCVPDDAAADKRYDHLPAKHRNDKLAQAYYDRAQEDANAWLTGM